ncbi:YggT family protein [Francisella adeliensis]|uniref:YggT family protein n=1 Tax=Francisella adeliensis TaxID=2007306 RepID=A0A2Z4XWB1_9GAMM|nr:YggT family protein [Francisella adeliensis]AXA32980.1 YggT family protein [Francisella adeliensis]MBK2086135.1 YggT family protein [Francisella adeliensis]MBK2096701.1 YggT family protein [Francisella adeliensis]QIW11206.1 YggT family protein [Francisella adeliensis]QIW13082.1 YggT family protein [Francisella adeliensis]
MLSGLVNVGDFLVNLVFGLYAFILLIRFFLQWVKADFYNPVCQLVMKATNPIVLLFRKVVPGFLGLDWACIVTAYFVFVIQNLILCLINGIGFNEIVVFVKPFLDIVFAIINMYVYLILIRAIASWFSQGGYNPVLMVIHQLTEPLLARARNIIKPRSGFDFSPILVMIALFCIQIFLQSVMAQIFA